MPDYDLGTARGKIELDASSLGRASAAFTGLGKGMIATGALAVGAFAYAVKSAADFEKVMSAVGAVSNATSAEMAALSEQALDLGANTVYGATEVGRAMEQLAKAGITVPEILGGATEATVTFAAAAGDELAGGIDQAAVVMSNAMKTFGAGVDDLDHFADVLVGAAASSTLSVDDMATSLTYVGPTAAALGLTIDDLSTALAILGDRNIRGSTAGTSLRGVLLSLTAQTPKATKVMKSLGLITEDGTNKFFDMNGALKPLPEIMQLLGDATKDLSEQEKLAAFNAIFQRRAMGAAMILAEQGAAGFDKYADAIARIDASDIAAKKLDNLSGDVTLLRNAFETLMIRVGRPFQEMLRGFVQGITDFVRKLNEVDPELLAQITLYAAIGGAVLIAAGSFLYMVGIAIKLYRNFKILVEGIKLVAGAVRLLTLSFLTNPIFLFIAAIVAIAAALYLAYTRSEEFRNRVQAAVKALEPIWKPVLGFIQNFIDQIGNLIDVFRDWDDVAQGVAEVVDSMFGGTGKLVAPIRTLVIWLQSLDEKFDAFIQFLRGPAADAFWDFADTVGRTVVDVVSWIIDEGIPAFVRFAGRVREEVGSVVAWFGDNVAPVFADVFGAIIALIDRVARVVGFFSPIFVRAFRTVGAVLKFAWKLINTFVQNVLLIWGNFGDNILRMLEFAWNRIRETVESVLRIVRGVITLFTGIISGDWGKAWDGIKQIFSGAWSLIIDYLQTVLGLIWIALSNFIDLVISVWEVGWNTLGDVIGGVLQLIKDLFLAFIAFTLEMFSRGWELLRDTAINVWNAIYSGVAGIVGQVVAAVSGMVTQTVDFFRGLWSKITSVLGDLGGKIYNFFLSAFKRMWTGAVSAYENLRSFVAGIPDKILNALGNVGRLLYEAGRKIVQGLIDGIGSLAGALRDKAEDLLGPFGGLLPGSPVKEGPLMVLNRGYAGAQIVKMLADGIEGQMPALRRLMTSELGMLPLMGTDSGNLAISASTAPQANQASTINVTLEFPNVTSAAEAEGIKTAVNDGAVLSKLVNTLKAGRR